MRLLLVEDDRTISRFLLKGLREDHHVVDLAEDGPAGTRPGRRRRLRCRRAGSDAAGTGRLRRVPADARPGDRHAGPGHQCARCGPRSRARARLRCRRLSRQAVRVRGAARSIARARPPRPESPDRPHACRTDRLTIDPVDHRVTLNGQTLSLTATEYRLLEYLVRRAESIVTRDQLAEYVWGGRLRSHAPTWRTSMSATSGGSCRRPHPLPLHSHRARARLHPEARGGCRHDALAARGHVPDDADVVVDARVRSAPGRRQPGGVRGVRAPISIAISISRCGPSRPPSWARRPTAPRSTCTSCRRTRSPGASTPRSSCRSSTPNGRLHLSSASLLGAPALVPADGGPRRPRRAGAPRHGRRRRPSRASRGAPDPQGL